MEIPQASEPQPAPGKKSRNRKAKDQAAELRTTLLTADEQAELLEMLGRGASPAAACQKLNLPVRSYYLTAVEVGEFRAALEEVALALNQNVEVALYHAAMKGNVSAQTLWLKHRPPPGWRGAEAGSTSDPFEKLSDAELVELARGEGLPIPPEIELEPQTPSSPNVAGGLSPGAATQRE